MRTNMKVLEFIMKCACLFAGVFLGVLIYQGGRNRCLFLNNYNRNKYKVNKVYDENKHEEEDSCKNKGAFILFNTSRTVLHGL